MKMMRAKALLATVVLVGFMSGLAGQALAQTPPTPPPTVPAADSAGTRVSTGLDHDFCTNGSGGINGLTVHGGSYPALIDASKSHGPCGSVNLKFAQYHCPITGNPLDNPQVPLGSDGTCMGRNLYGWGSRLTASPVATTVGHKYTWRFWAMTDQSPGGVMDIVINNENESFARGMPSTANVWQEYVLNFKASATTTMIDLFRVVSTSSTANLWVDDLELIDGWDAESTPSAKQPFNGTYVTVDALGNFRRQNATTGAWEDYFPWCMADDFNRMATIYVKNGWNCMWAVNHGNFTDLVWNGAAYVPNNWSSPSNFLNMAAAAVDAEFAPDGMSFFLAINEAVRGAPVGSGFAWNMYIDDLVVQATNNINARSPRRLLGFMHDAENNFDKLNRAKALLDEVHAADALGHPVISNVGLAGAESFYYKDGIPFTDYMGVYSLRPGEFWSNRNVGAQKIPDNYCQINSMQGYGAGAFRFAVYQCLAQGAKMFAYWRDSLSTAYGVQDITLNSWYPDLKELRREQISLWPLLKTEVPRDWTIDSSNDAIEAWPRVYNGKRYIVAFNHVGSAQTATLTLSTPITAASPIRDWFDSSADAVFNGSNQVTVTLPGQNSSSKARGLSSTLGQDGGTAVWMIDDPNTNLPTTTTTSTTPGSTTTTTTIPVTSIDDPSFTYSAHAATEADGWVQYGPNLAGAVGDYNLGNTVTSKAGATSTITFTGTQASLHGALGPSDGQFTISVDGGPAQGPFSAYATTEQRDVEIYNTGSLANGTHTITVTVLGSHVAGSNGDYVVLDRLIVSNPGATSSITPICAGWCAPIPSDTDPFVLGIGAVALAVAIRRQRRTSRR